MKFLVTTVKKPLAAVSAIVDEGNVVVFGPGKDGSFIQNKGTGSKLWLAERNGVYELPSYIAPCSLFEKLSSDFTRQGR